MGAESTAPPEAAEKLDGASYERTGDYDERAHTADGMGIDGLPGLR